VHQRRRPERAPGLAGNSQLCGGAGHPALLKGLAHREVAGQQDVRVATDPQGAGFALFEGNVDD